MKIQTPKGAGAEVDRVQAGIIKILEDGGRYADDLWHQTRILAQTHVMREHIFEEVMTENPSGICKEVSREGNERISADPRMKMIVDLSALEDKILKGLGMNTAGKVRETESNGFKQMMELMAEDD